MNEVAKSASSIELDNSQLANLARKIDDIAAQIDADAEILQLAPKYFGQIPVDKDSVLDQEDILEEMENFFSNRVQSEVVTK
jgi:hypothetical protein